MEFALTLGPAAVIIVLQHFAWARAVDETYSDLEKQHVRDMAALHDRHKAYVAKLAAEAKDSIDAARARVDDANARARSALQEVELARRALGTAANELIPR